MTQTGKCDTCRQRKVKCDEERPQCGACQKKDRPCAYSYGKASAFVVQDPNQLTKHGRSRIAPVVYALGPSKEGESNTSISTPSDLQITTEREAENGQGFFQTLAPISRRKDGISKKTAAHRRKKLEQHLQTLLMESSIGTMRPLSPEHNLAAKFINMLGPYPAELQPLSILGTWIQTIPSRVGSNRMMDLATEFLVNSFAVFTNDTYSKRALASASKETALKELQLTVLKSNSQPTYDILLATKMHYAAEALMGIDTGYHAIHAFGLAELLKSGMILNVDDEHYWNLIDNTYVDDVNEAMLAGRKSVYDNEFYLASTYPPPLLSDTVSLSPYQRASMAIMHIFVQCPRLNCMVRTAVANPDSASNLVAAVSMAESLWQLNISEQVSPLLESAITTKPVPPVEELADLMPRTLHFSSVQNSILCTRYWMLLNLLCGLIDTLHRHFPAETTLSQLPGPNFLQHIETEAAIQLAQSLSWSASISQNLPLVPLRLHTPLQISLGSWYRLIRRSNTLRPGLTPEAELSISNDLDRAYRMKAWLIWQCNIIHSEWDVSPVGEAALLEAIDTMAGEKIPDWLPTRIRFEAEDGEMVLKLEYANKTGSYAGGVDLTQPPKSLKAESLRFYSDLKEMYGTNEFKPTPRATHLPTRDTSMRPKDGANFIHATGRNLCSTSGWWPSTDDEPRLLLDSTHKASTFSQFPRFVDVDDDDATGEDDRHPCLASSFWPQTPMGVAVLDASTPDDVRLTPTMGSTTTMGIKGKGGSGESGWVDGQGMTPASSRETQDKTQ